MAGGAIRRLPPLRSPIWPLAAVATSMALYASIAGTAFTGDDYEGILDVVGGPAAGWLTEVGTGGNLRPVAWASLWLTHAAFGTDPFGWHLVSMILHGLVAWLVACTVAAVVDGARAGAAGSEEEGEEGAAGVHHGSLRPSVVGLLAGATFLVSPAHTEAVAWVAARGDLLLALGCTASLLAWVRSRRSSQRIAWWSFAAFACALLAKESAVALPAVLLAHEAWLPRQGEPPAGRWRRTLVAMSPHLVLVAAFSFVYLSNGVGTASAEARTLAGEGPLLVARRSVQLTLRSILPPMPAPVWWVVGVVLVLMACALVARRGALTAALGPQLRSLGFFATAFVLALGPAARLGASPFTTAGGRLGYWPGTFVAGAVGLGLAVLLQRAPRPGRVVVVLWLAASCVLVVVVDQTYVDGGRLVDGVVESAAALPVDEPVVLLVAPDVLGGSWAGRGALAPALTLVHGWEEPPLYVEATGVELAAWDGTVTTGPGSCARCVVLRLDDPDALFVWPLPGEVPFRVETGRPGDKVGATVHRVEEREVEIELDAEADRSRFWYVSGGRLVPLG